MVQRLSVARTVLHEPELLLLDEPRANLDPAAADLIEPLIGAASGRTRVITSHDPAGGLAEADLALGLRAGRAALMAPAAEVGPPRGRAVRMTAAPADSASLLDGGSRCPRQRALAMRHAVAAVLRKDLRLELRAPQAVPAMALFNVTTLVVFHFALQRNSVEGELAAACSP